ncbi:MAG: type II toxin-antitoxin system VapC family toxin [Acidobacteriota bacterium]
MRLLLDTHAFLWFVLDDPQMSPTAKTLIADPRNDVEVTPASYWEIAIKVSLGRYELTEPYRTFIEGEMAVNQLRILHIEPKHTEVLTTLPWRSSSTASSE